MARLYEHQGKELLRRMGIPVPKGGVAHSQVEAARIAQEIGFPVALKAQVLAGGRGKAGGIRFAATTEEGRRAACALLGEGLPDHVPRNILRRPPGATSADPLALAPVLCNLYRTYRTYDCKLVEINPLALTPEGPVAADARVGIDDDA